MVRKNEALSHDEKTDIYYDTWEQLEKLLSDSHIWYDIDHSKQYGSFFVIAVQIEGDWKHDHWYADELVKKEFGNRLVNIDEYEIGDSHEDYYVAVHEYMFDY